jgi:hypothetical protein
MANLRKGLSRIEAQKDKKKDELTPVERFYSEKWAKFYSFIPKY